MTPVNPRLWSRYDMLKFYADRFVYLSANLVHLKDILRIVEDEPEKHPANIAYTKKHLVNEAIPTLDTIGLRFSKKKALEIVNWPDALGMTGLKEALEELQSRIKHELEDGTFLFLDENEIKWMAPKEPLFGTDFETKFPSAAFDLDEAAKCKGLGRDTACAFHLMRVTEIGLTALGKCLSIPDPVRDADRNWGFTLRKVREAIEARKNANPFSEADKTAIPEIYACLDSVRVAWRNNTMHVETKFTPDESEHLFVVVRGFMKRVSSRMDEQGLPLA